MPRYESKLSSSKGPINPMVIYTHLIAASSAAVTTGRADVHYYPLFCASEAKVRPFFKFYNAMIF